MEIANQAAFGGIVGAEHIRAASESDAVEGVASQWLIEPGSEEQMAQLLRLANESGLSVIAKGGGTKIGWGNPPRGADIILSTSRLNQVLEHAAGDMTATVRAGCTVECFNQTVAQRGQRLAIDPLWPGKATIGGILASNDSGSLRGAFGPLRDFLLGITVVLADGTIAKSGGKVVKNVAGYDLPKLFTGSFGTLGVITQATFRLYPIPRASRTLRFAAPSTATFTRCLSALADCEGIATGAQIEMDQESIHVSILVEGIQGAIDTKADRIIRAVSQAGCTRVEPSPDCWRAGESLFEDPNACISKTSLLPSHWPGFCQRIREVSRESGLVPKLIAQAVGVGLVSLSSPEPHRLPLAITTVRRELANLSGSLTLLRCPTPLKRQLDVWPDPGDALALMRRIKAQFDPRNTLSPGRFVGGI
jgi:glycolate oxidase FAD binding subunit